MLANFSKKKGGCRKMLLSSLLGLCFFRYFSPTGPWGTPPGSDEKSIQLWLGYLGDVVGRLGAVLGSSWGPNLGPKMELKWSKNRCKNQSKIWCILKSIFGAILMDLGTENEAKLAPKSIKNRCQLRKTIFWKFVLSLSGGSMFESLGVEVGSKDRSKIDVKNDAETEGLGI